MAAGIFDAAELADAQRELPEAVFRELYYAEASDDRAKSVRRWTRFGGAWPHSRVTATRWVGMGPGPERRLDRRHRARRDGAVCRFERRQGTWEQIFDTIVARTGDVPALVDSTGVGDPIVERLQRSGGTFHGFQFSAPAKQQLMEGLAVAIQQQRVHVPDGLITSELETFEYEYTRTGVRYCAPAGLHDDCVCALALAVRHYASEFDAEPLRLLNVADPNGGDDRETFVERAICQNGAFFPSIGANSVHGHRRVVPRGDGADRLTTLTIECAPSHGGSRGALHLQHSAGKLPGRRLAARRAMGRIGRPTGAPRRAGYSAVTSPRPVDRSWPSSEVT